MSVASWLITVSLEAESWSVTEELVTAAASRLRHLNQRSNTGVCAAGCVCSWRKWYCDTVDTNRLVSLVVAAQLKLQIWLRLKWLDQKKKKESHQANATELTGLLSADAELQVSPSASLDIKITLKNPSSYDSEHCNQ